MVPPATPLGWDLPYAKSRALPAGAIDSESGTLVVRTRGQAYSQAEFARVPIRAANGAEVLLGDVAQIKDGFEEGDKRATFAARLNKSAAWSLDCAAEKSCEFALASGPHRCSSSSSADSVVFAFFRPNEMIARRVGVS